MKRRKAILTEQVILGCLVSPVRGGLGVHETIIPKDTIVTYKAGDHGQVGIFVRTEKINFIERRLVGDKIIESQSSGSKVFQVMNPSKLQPIS